MLSGNKKNSINSFKEKHNAHFVYKNIALYQMIQDCIAEKYSHTYDATIYPEPDLFFYLKNVEVEEDVCGGCFGINPAKDKELFSEQYLEDTVEQVLALSYCISTKREYIAEVSSVISYRSPGMGEKIIAIMPYILSLKNYQYILITANYRVRAIFNKFNIDFQPLCLADKNKIKGSVKNWGSYYESFPVTGVINIANSLRESDILY